MDFYQEKITTIHDFATDDGEVVRHLTELSRFRPTALIIPMLYKEIKSPSLANIVNELNKCEFINEVIISLAADNKDEYEDVINFFGELKLNHLVVWCNGPNVTKVVCDMRDKDLDITQFKGKGKDVWLAIGIASLNSFAIALHDADVKTYSMDFPAKLLYPILNPRLNFLFNKGFYARINKEEKTMHGRVFRLFVRPFLAALQRDVKYESYVLDYLSAFRYALAGEFALTSDIALHLRIPSDWGLEVGLLAEVYRNSSLKRTCQTDLGIYDHKHKDTRENVSEGLCKMVNDIVLTLLRIANETTSVHISQSFVQGVYVKYIRFAQDLIRQHHADAICNNLKYDRHAEERYVEVFSQILLNTGNSYLEIPLSIQMPDWKRALSAIPDLREQLKSAALKDLDALQ
ncbi:glucosyl-3-phosphoglycerate synthase [Methanolobus bombayensis]|uniref:glucosyl-3-phosphoglycerate synthase n=1 Tax=Methanolobus bombayensis TaxID=38023 RepID=UPI001AE938C8|nr:glucosyl-3-phosphoglycerate synthase [Methanolobus bombayensis]MBP1909932.1 glucosyl-3-phosphoglycerate synthase [Methanolobus bombayensis]